MRGDTWYLMPAGSWVIFNHDVSVGSKESSASLTTAKRYEDQKQHLVSSESSLLTSTFVAFSAGFIVDEDESSSRSQKKKRRKHKGFGEDGSRKRRKDSDDGQSFSYREQIGALELIFL